MPPKQKDKHPPIEELIADYAEAAGVLKFLAEIVDWRYLPQEEQRRILKIKQHILELLEMLRDREDTPPQTKRRMELWFKRLGVRKTRKRSVAGQPADHKG